MTDREALLQCYYSESMPKIRRARHSGMTCVSDDALRVAFKAHTEGQDKFTRRMAITLGLMFDIGPMGLVMRLEKMGLLKSGSWEWFVDNGGISRAQIEEVKADLANPRAKADP